MSSIVCRSARRDQGGHDEVRGCTGSERDLHLRASRRGRSRPRTGRRRPRDELDAGAVRLRRRRRRRARRRCARTARRSSGAGSGRGCSTGNSAARPLRRGARHALAGAVPARADRRALRSPIPRASSPSRARPPRRASRSALERRVALDRGDRRGDGRRAALVPALLGQRTARSSRASCAAPRRRATARSSSRSTRSILGWRPRDLAQRVPPVHPGRGLRAVLHRSGLPELPRGAAGGGPAHGRGDDALHLPEPRPDLGRPRRGCAS